MKLSLETISNFSMRLQQAGNVGELAQFIPEQMGTLLGLASCEFQTVGASQSFATAWALPSEESREGVLPELRQQAINSKSVQVSPGPPRQIAAPILNGGEVIGVVTGIHRCNTVPVEFLEESLRLLAALTSPSLSTLMTPSCVSKFKSVLDALQEAVIITDAELTVLHINERASALTGIECRNATGKNLQSVFPVQGVPAKASSVQPRNNLRDQLTIAAGTVFSVQWSIHPLSDHDPAGFVVVFDDVTQQDYLVQQAERAQRNESLGVFVGGIAHDFNNNLQSILSGLVAARTKAPKEIRQLLDAAERAGERSRGLTHQLMAFAKGSATQAEVTDLKELVQATSTLIVPSRRSKVEITAAPNLHQVHVVRSQIEQVITNLLINAIQSYDDGGTVQIELSNQPLASDPQSSAVEIRISDQGKGIAPEELKQIFKPYYSTKPDGHGLGLATSYFIVQRHGGEIQAESEPGKGTTIRVLLPVAEMESATSETPKTKSRKQPTGPKRKILFIDDEPTVQQSVCAVIASLGHQAISARNQQEAVELFQEAIQSDFPFDAVIIDLNIPSAQGGLRILRCLQEIHPDVRAIVTSGYSNDPVMVNPSHYGFVGVLPKPFNRKTLLNEIERASND